MNWRKNYSSKWSLGLTAALMSSFFFACATPPPPTPEQKEAARKEKVRTHFESQYDWAVQRYETGQYEQALKSLIALKKDGAIVSAFESIPYYLGMCYYRLGKFADAQRELELFLDGQGNPVLIQNAGMNLLLIYEEERAWDKLVSLAAQLDRNNLYQNNRILLKLLWGNALLEQGELLGARQSAADAYGLLQNQPPLEYEPQMSQKNSNEDLWGRYYFTALKAKLLGCERLNPKEVKTKKGKSQKLYIPWIDASSTCYQETEKVLVENLIKPQSSWLSSALSAYSTSLDRYAPKLQQMFEEPGAHLEVRRELNEKVRQSFYELMHYTEEAGKAYENQPLARQHLDRLEKQFDRLIYSLALPSSNN